MLATEGDPTHQGENAPQHILQEITLFLQGQGLGTVEFTAFSDNVDRFGAEISLEVALDHLAQKTLQERIYNRRDLLKAESDLRRCELRVALIDERIAYSAGRKPGYAPANITAFSLRNKLLNAYERTKSGNAAKVEAMRDLRSIQSKGKFTGSM